MERFLHPQLKVAEKHEDTDILLWEEKIRLAEEDAQKAVERAERAERRLQEMERNRPAQKRNSLMSRISYFENGGEKKEIEEVREEVSEVVGEFVVFTLNGMYLQPVALACMTFFISIGS